jgi:pyruvate dehydrogenase E2 component (dihydrolipoamide acetyltransferase)
MFEFKLPDLGEGVQEAEIVRVLVNEGDTVAEYQPLMEVETDKAAVEIPSPKAGVISRLYVEQGQTVQVGDVLVVIDESGAQAGDAKPAAAAAADAEAPKQDAEGQEQKAKGPKEEAAQKAPAKSPAPSPSAPAAVGEAQEAPARRDGPVAAAPVIRKRARELGVDINEIAGTGPGGRVLREDVERFARGEGAASPAAEGGLEGPPLQIPSEPLPDFDKHGKIRREKPAQIRKTIARQMTRSWLSIPRVTHSDNADITELEHHRKQYNASLREGETKLTTTAIVIKAIASALHRHPKVNCTYDVQNEEIIYKDYVHMGIAVDTPRGLVVPVIRDVDRKPLPQVAGELADVAERTRTAKFDIAELRGATFTITNVGLLGGTFVTPMINFPEVAILALGRAGWQPKVMEDMQIVPRLLLPLSLSFDHRIVDGADAARFVSDVIGSLENPLRLLS